MIIIKLIVALKRVSVCIECCKPEKAFKVVSPDTNSDVAMKACFHYLEETKLFLTK